MLTVEEACTRYMAEMAVGWSASTRYQQARFLAHLVRTFGPLRLHEVTPERLRRWKGELATQHKASTVARYLRYVGAMLAYAVECEWLGGNPMAKVRKPPAGPGRMRFLSAAERQRLLVACRLSANPALYPLVVLALSTGGRKNELRCLRWPEVDLAAGVVRFVRTKTHHDRAVPLLGEARLLLEARATQRRPGVSWVFARPDGRRPWDIEGAWRTARRIADLEDFRFHDLRHTCASYLAMSGASLRDIAEVLGHTRIQQTMVYSHLLDSHTRGVVERMVQRMLE